MTRSDGSKSECTVISFDSAQNAYKVRIDGSGVLKMASEKFLAPRQGRPQTAGASSSSGMSTPPFMGRTLPPQTLPPQTLPPQTRQPSLSKDIMNMAQTAEEDAELAFKMKQFAAAGNMSKSASTAAAKNAADNSTCVLCGVKQASHAFVPCGHQCVCADCSTEDWLEDCPICRKPFTTIKRVTGDAGYPVM